MSQFPIMEFLIVLVRSGFEVAFLLTPTAPNSFEWGQLEVLMRKLTSVSLLISHWFLVIPRLIVRSLPDF